MPNKVLIASQASNRKAMCAIKLCGNVKLQSRHIPLFSLCENAPLVKINYSYEKRQRELAKKKQQDEKLAKKKSTREPPQPPNGERDPSTGRQ
jgi:hypothetical protein